MFHVGNICEMKQDSHQETKETIMSDYFFSASCQLIRSKLMFNWNPIKVHILLRKEDFGNRIFETYLSAYRISVDAFSSLIIMRNERESPVKNPEEHLLPHKASNNSKILLSIG